jgi:hypothetical protein
MVLPQVETMTPALLAKIRDLVKAGATVVGNPPLKSPSLSGYPACDAEVQKLAKGLWGGQDAPQMATKRAYGKGAIHWGGELSPPAPIVQRNSVSESEWIWYPEGNPAQSAPVGTRYFKRIIQVDEKKVLESAAAALSADNEFTLWINGKKVSEGDNFNVTVTTPIASFLRPGDNVIAMAVVNGGGEPSPAGWIGAFDIRYKDGSSEVVKTDGKWTAGLSAEEGWQETAANPKAWKDAQVLGDYTMAPWHRGGDGQSLPPLYPDYELTAAILKSTGVVEDFTANGPVRYGHRRTDKRDIYFVANRSDAPVKAECRFRVGRGTPQLWDPVTGEMRPLPRFERKEGATTIPLEFDAFQSFFVVFDTRRPASGVLSPHAGRNFPELKPVQELSGPWEVAFDPKWGGPGGAEVGGQKSEVGDRRSEDSKNGKILFEKLQDWTERPEPGIKYYSGIAVYRKVFNFAGDVSKTNADLRPLTSDLFARSFLSLGTVHDMARVKLNGKDLGVVWCAPWRVEVTGAIRSGENQLEIEVANRWPNRMIGDKQPADANARRYTSSTHEPFGADSPLLPSGLFGPVRVMSGK